MIVALRVRPPAPAGGPGPGPGPGPGRLADRRVGQNYVQDSIVFIILSCFRRGRVGYKLYSSSECQCGGESDSEPPRPRPGRKDGGRRRLVTRKLEVSVEPKGTVTLRLPAASEDRLTRSPGPGRWPHSATWQPALGCPSHGPSHESLLRLTGRTVLSRRSAAAARADDRRP